MSFDAAGRLWLVAVPLALAVAYLALQVRRRWVVARFSDEVMLPSVLPRRASWQRHLSAVLLGAVLLLLTLGFAGPRTVSERPRKAAIVVFAIDTSASMAATDVAPTRLDAARRATESLIADLPSTFRVGVVTFGTVPDLLVAPTLDREAVTESLAALTPAHATATAAAIRLALQAIKDARAGVGPLKATVVLVTDGSPSVGLPGQSPQQAMDTEAAAAKAADVPVHTIACGTAAGAATLARVARESGGMNFTARSAGQLSSIYRGLGTVIGKVRTTHDLTALFTGAALAAACLAGAAGLRWSDRLLP